MASLIEYKPGRWAIQFPFKGRRPYIRFEKINKRDAHAWAAHVEEIINANLSAQPFAHGTADWLRSLPDPMHAKLADAGLVQPRSARAVTQVAAFLDRFIKDRTATLKPRTLANLKQVRNGLVDHFTETRDIATITRGDIGDWHRGLKAKGLSTATLAMHIKKAKQMFADAVDRKLIPENPARTLKAGSMANDERQRYVPAGDIVRAIEASPDAEWRLLFALARFGGLRVPSETNALRWDDINWEAGKILVRASKTEHIAGRATRLIPLFPELLPYLRECFELAEPGANRVVVRHRGENLRTHGARIAERAGLPQWPKFFQNMRSSRETDLTAHFPLHVVCAWIGNTEVVARKHYLQTTEQHFADANGKSAANRAADSVGQHRTNTAPQSEKPRISAGFPETSIPPRGIEQPREMAEFLGVSKEALRNALHRLEVASPYLHQAEILRVQSLMDVRQGGAK